MRDKTLHRHGISHPGVWVASALLVMAALLWVGAPVMHHLGRPKSAVAAAVSPDVFHGVSQQALAHCIAQHQNCAAVVPGLAHCMKHYRICNKAGASAVQSGSPNLSQPVAADASLKSKAQAEKGWAQQGTITQALLTTYGALHRALPILAASLIINPTRPVWVIPVHYSSPQLFQGSEPSGVGPLYFSWLRVVVDAASGAMTDESSYGTTPPPISPANGIGG